MEHDGETWPARWNAVIGEQLRRYRRDRDLSAAQLATRCADLGLPMSRAKIANMESGRARQEGVSIAEIAVLAAALGVPPVLLVYPVGQQETIEVLPDRTIPTWDAARWFSGERPLTHRGRDGGMAVDPQRGDSWKRDRAPLTFYEDQEQLVREWDRARSGEQADQIGQQLAALRRSMRLAGIRTGSLPDNLKHIDQEEDQ